MAAAQTEMVSDQAEKRYQVFTSLLQMMTPPGADQPSPEERIAVQLTILETLEHVKNRMAKIRQFEVNLWKIGWPMEAKHVQDVLSGKLPDHLRVTIVQTLMRFPPPALRQHLVQPAHYLDLMDQVAELSEVKLEISQEWSKKVGMIVEECQQKYFQGSCSGEAA